MSEEIEPTVTVDMLHDVTKYIPLTYQFDIAKEGDLFYNRLDLKVRKVAVELCINRYFISHAYFTKIMTTPKGNKVI